MVRLDKISAFDIIILVGRCTSNATTFTKNAVIGYDDIRFEGTEVIVDGCTLIVDGEHTFESLKVLHGGVITHSEMSTSILHLIVEEDAYIDAGSCIDVTGKGYSPGMGPGKGEDGDYWGGGAGHGGKGDRGWKNGFDAQGGHGGEVYGDPKHPAVFGSSGGAGHGFIGGLGGGAVWLDVQGTMRLDGTITANGTNGTAGTLFEHGGGGGFGGSIWLNVGTLTGLGHVSADGGCGYVDITWGNSCGVLTLNILSMGFFLHE